MSNRLKALGRTARCLRHGRRPPSTARQSVKAGPVLRPSRRPPHIGQHVTRDEPSRCAVTTPDDMMTTDAMTWRTKSRSTIRTITMPYALTRSRPAHRSHTSASSSWAPARRHRTHRLRLTAAHVQVIQSGATPVCRCRHGPAFRCPYSSTDVWTIPRSPRPLDGVYAASACRPVPCPVPRTCPLARALEDSASKLARAAFFVRVDSLYWQCVEPRRHRWERDMIGEVHLTSRDCTWGGMCPQVRSLHCQGESICIGIAFAF